MASAALSKAPSSQPGDYSNQEEIVMAVDDFMEPEVAIAVAVTAAVASPPVRKAIRRGLVYGLAGLLTAGDKIMGAARDLAQSAQQTATSAGNTGTEAQQTSPAPRIVSG